MRLPTGTPERPATGPSRRAAGRPARHPPDGSAGGSRNASEAGWMVGMTLERIAWSAVLLACLITALLLAVSGFLGYAGLTAAVALAAALNLR